MNRMTPSAAGLTALLDALEQDLLAAPKDEVREALSGVGRARDAACQEIRSLLNQALAASDDGSAATTPSDTRGRTGLPRH